MRTDWLSDQERRRIWWPSVAAAALPFGLLWLAPSRWDAADLVVAGILTLTIAVVALGAPRKRLPRQAPVAIAFAYLIVIVALRMAGGNSGVAPVALLPVFWLSLYGTRGQLWCLLAGVALTLFVPLALGNPSTTPPGSWRAGILLVVVSAIVGMTLQSLVTRVREHARERERLVAKLADLALTDSLTGVANRRAWEAELNRGLARAWRTHEPMTVAVADIDRFKAINDLHGHAVGDRLLAEVARNWSSSLRADDVIARIGGDEFALLLPGCTEAEAADLLKRLRAGVPRPHSCSVGVATWDRRESAGDLIRRADDALYDAKRHRVDHARATTLAN
jgi:diguanylate cyclase (GGDEF)-like protein